MKELNPQKVALTFGSFLALWHVVWSVLVLLGFAQALLDFVFWAHMIANPFHVTGFNLTSFITLVIITFAVGSGAGFVFATIWNWLHK